MSDASLHTTAAIHVPCPDLGILVSSVKLLTIKGQPVMGCVQHPMCLVMHIPAWQVMAEHVHEMSSSPDYQRWARLRGIYTYLSDKGDNNR